MSDDFKRGKFSPEENDYITQNCKEMSDAQIAAALNRPVHSVSNRRKKMGLIGNYKGGKPKQTRERKLAQITDEEKKKKFLEKEVMESSKFKTARKAFTEDEQEYYIEQYVDFMLDPTIETMTSAEKGILHNKIFAEIQLQRYMAEEKNMIEIIERWKDSQGGITIEDVKNIPTISRAREIKDCQDTIMKCNKSLNVEREQRLKNQNDQSATFVNLVKEMKSPENRYHMGLEAVMLKVIAEHTYNSKLGKNIVSGKEDKYDMRNNFRDGKVPDLPDKFLPDTNDDE